LGKNGVLGSNFGVFGGKMTISGLTFMFLDQKWRFQVRLQRFCRKNGDFKPKFSVFRRKNGNLKSGFLDFGGRNYFFQGEPELFTGEGFSPARKLKSRVRIIHFWSKNGSLQSRLTIYCH